MTTQLIFRQTRQEAERVEQVAGTRFLFCRGVADAFGILSALVVRFGLFGALRKLARVSTKNRMYYCLLENRRIVNDGDVTLSFCRFYKVDAGAAVIGPVWTDTMARNRGLATHALKSAMNTMLSRGIHVFYVDTASDNVPMRKVIDRCGFGAPIGSFEKSDD